MFACHDLARMSFGSSFEYESDRRFSTRPRINALQNVSFGAKRKEKRQRFWRFLECSFLKLQKNGEIICCGSRILRYNYKSFLMPFLRELT